MRRRRRLLSATITVLLLVMGSTQNIASEEEAQAKAGSDEVARIAARIDQHIEREWKANGITPAQPADDAEFLRRVYLDVVGKIPPAAVVVDFLDDPAPDKRHQLVDRLLDDPGYITHFATVWRNVMLPEANADFQVRFLVPGFDGWLRQQLAENKRYDELTREILNTPLETPQGRNRNPYERLGGSSPLAFYQAKQIAPENLAAASSRIFLGIRLECAQCHDHPFDHWKREQFWELAAFFAGIERQGDRGVFGQVRELFDRREINIPGTKRVVQAGYLDGSQPKWKFRVGPRQTLAQWVTSPENPYFARTAVNRMWGHFFGVGIVDPVDDFTAANPPSHPELLDALAEDFAAYNFDLKVLIRAITASRAYGLSSQQTHPSQDRSQLFARMAVKGLQPEQIYDSLAQATGLYQPFRGNNLYNFGGNTPRSEFLETFANDAESPTERQTTILQALAMMNGQIVTAATNTSNSRTLAAILEFPGDSNAARIEKLYLVALSRKPRPDELKRLSKYVESEGTSGDARRAMGDIFWALLNSSEFLFNH